LDFSFESKAVQEYLNLFFGATYHFFGFK